MDEGWWARPLPPGRIRKAGGGRPKLTEKDPTLWTDLERLVEPTTRGDPTSSLRWTCKSLRELAAALRAKGHTISHDRVGHLLKEHGYSLKGTRKTLEGTNHPDRNEQFEHIHRQVEHYQSLGQPVIPVDAKKKELIGDFSNLGREWHAPGSSEDVNVHDFPSASEAKAVPYGVFDIARNEAIVGVGIDHDTVEDAVSSILRWWRDMGKAEYPEATDVLITADGGGSNGSRLRLWKVQLQRLADETGLVVSVCHLPPGTSKWNRIEHRLFCYITRNWRGRPLRSLDTMVNLIGATKTRKGLQVRAILDEAGYPTGIRVSDAELAEIQIERDRFHGDWNYTILPR